MAKQKKIPISQKVTLQTKSKISTKQKYGENFIERELDMIGYKKITSFGFISYFFKVKKVCNIYRTNGLLKGQLMIYPFSTNIDQIIFDSCE